MGCNSDLGVCLVYSFRSLPCASELFEDTQNVLFPVNFFVSSSLIYIKSDQAT